MDVKADGFDLGSIVLLLDSICSPIRLRSASGRTLRTPGKARSLLRRDVPLFP
jgi:hypothetical protein